MSPGSQSLLQTQVSFSSVISLNIPMEQGQVCSPANSYRGFTQCQHQAPGSDGMRGNSALWSLQGWDGHRKRGLRSERSMDVRLPGSAI